ncbi:MAG: hypothetical protein K2Q01_10045 [Rickettsiales bacterium]|nr:hypothetical protein [Rickettsiales bacterium]
MSNSAGECLEAVAYRLMHDLLMADGKAVLPKGQPGAASREEVATAYAEAIILSRSA